MGSRDDCARSVICDPARVWEGEGGDLIRGERAQVASGFVNRRIRRRVLSDSVGSAKRRRTEQEVVRDLGVSRQQTVERLLLLDPRVSENCGPWYVRENMPEQPYVALSCTEHAGGSLTVAEGNTAGFNPVAPLTTSTSPDSIHIIIYR